MRARSFLLTTFVAVHTAGLAACGSSPASRKPDRDDSGDGSGGRAASTDGATPGSGGANDASASGGRSTGGSGPDAGADATVVDSSPPALTIQGAAEVVVDCGESFEDPGAQASDAEDGDVEVVVTGAGAVTTAAPGTFVVTYTATDAAGNVSTSARTVHVCGGGCGELGKTPVSVSNWSVVQYEQNSQGDASWVIAPDGLSVRQVINADASILLSDFDAKDLAVEGRWRMETASDDDFVGFVFGYQDRGHYYLFDWKQGTQTFGGGVANAGMTLKVVDVAGVDAGAAKEDAGAPLQLTTEDLWYSSGTANVRILERDGTPYFVPTPWAFNTDYYFSLEFHSGKFRIRVTDAQQVELVSWVVEDSTYVDGRFGFYNYSQGPVAYQSFTQRATPVACSEIDGADAAP